MSGDSPRQDGDFGLERGDGRLQPRNGRAGLGHKSLRAHKVDPRGRVALDQRVDQVERLAARAQFGVAQAQTGLLETQIDIGICQIQQKQQAGGVQFRIRHGHTGTRSFDLCTAGAIDIQQPVKAKRRLGPGDIRPAILLFALHPNAW